MKRLLIVEKDDLQVAYQNLPVSEINLEHFNSISYSNTLEYDIVLFMGIDRSMKIIKSRYSLIKENEIF